MFVTNYIVMQFVMFVTDYIVMQFVMFVTNYIVMQFVMFVTNYIVKQFVMFVTADCARIERGWQYWPESSTNQTVSLTQSPSLSCSWQPSQSPGGSSAR